MKGHSPTNFNSKSNHELSTKLKGFFIELGNMNNHDEVCECEDCRNENK